MKILTKILSIPVAFFLLSASCKEENTKPETGFYCKVNGKQWWPNSTDFKVQAEVCHLQDNEETLFITALQSNTNEHIALFASTPGVRIQEKTYFLNSDRVFGATFDKSIGNDDFKTINGYSGEITVTKIDRTAKRVQATFHFKAFNRSTQEVVEITEGTINLPYVTY